MINNYSTASTPVMAPGEMEQVVLQKKQLIETENPRTITIKIEEA